LAAALALLWVLAGDRAKPGGETQSQQSPGAAADAGPASAAAPELERRAASADEGLGLRSFIPEGAFIEAIALGPDDAPIPQLGIELSRSGSHGMEVIDTKRTDAAGHARFELPRAPAGWGYFARAAGPHISELTHAALFETVVLLCTKGTALDIKTTLGGAATPARVQVVELTQGQSREPAVPIETDAQGRAQLFVFDKRRYELTAFTTSAISQAVVVSTSATNPNETVELRLAGNTLDVWVLKDGSRQPVAGVEIVYNGQRLSLAPTDDNGRTRMLAVDDSWRNMLSIYRDGEPLLSGDGWVREGDRNLCLLTEYYNSIGRYAVEVVDEGGRPVQGAAVGWNRTCGVSGLPQSFTDAKGLAAKSLGAQVKGTRAALVCKSGYMPQIVPLPNPNETPVRIALAAAIPTRVHVVDGDSKPVPFAYVWIDWKADEQTYGISQLCDTSGVAEVFAPAGATVVARGPRADTFSEKQSIDPANHEMTIVVAQPKSAELAGTIRGPGETPPLGPFRIEILGGPAATFRKEIPDPKFSFRGSWSSLVHVKVEDLASGATGEYYGRPNTNITVKLAGGIDVLLDVRGDAAQPPLLTAARVSNASEEKWVPAAFSKAGDAWKIQIPSIGEWNLRVSAGALRGTLEGIRVNAPTGVPQRFTVALVGAARLEITIDNDLRLESVNAKFRRRPLQGAADTAHTNNDLNRLKPEPNGRFALEDPIPGIYDVLLVGMRAPGDHWMAAATEVVVAPSKVTVCTAASARLRKVGIGAPSGADASTFVGWRAIPRGPLQWIRGDLALTIKSDPEGVYGLLWSGTYDLVDEKGAARGSLTVVDESDSCVAEVPAAK
jgi:hypothetical protein